MLVPCLPVVAVSRCVAVIDAEHHLAGMFEAAAPTGETSGSEPLYCKQVDAFVVGRVVDQTQQLQVEGESRKGGQFSSFRIFRFSRLDMASTTDCSDGDLFIDLLSADSHGRGRGLDSIILGGLWTTEAVAEMRSIGR